MKRSCYRVPLEKQQAILAELVKAAELAEQAKQYTLKAIAERQGIHKRTVQKLIRRLGVEHTSAARLRR